MQAFEGYSTRPLVLTPAAGRWPKAPSRSDTLLRPQAEIERSRLDVDAVTVSGARVPVRTEFELLPASGRRAVSNLECLSEFRHVDD